MSELDGQVQADIARRIAAIRAQLIELRGDLRIYSEAATTSEKQANGRASAAYWRGRALAIRKAITLLERELVGLGAPILGVGEIKSRDE